VGGARRSVPARPRRGRASERGVAEHPAWPGELDVRAPLRGPATRHWPPRLGPDSVTKPIPTTGE